MVEISGIKRHLAVDSQGLPHAIHVTTANVGDRQGALEAFQQSSANLSNVIKVLGDGTYTGADFAQKVKTAIGASVETVIRSELHTFEVIPTRWVVERSMVR